ncbi:FGGY-family carbohydrate kinase [Actinotalea sp. M2MS4P-6]|uniref:xylulokinase n=1 Tax=Actinotalea sp. M2MS4P-6 TaxID=2983762 RepID=UPI0021E4A53D|nr:FGGY-family carbohydrate kinase [Actinotalea sp. M2MS4P-6]MCV2392956.1 FGGY-family carbohydrate kinase [Actinotalea sp. M2MS4P-6]
MSDDRYVLGVDLGTGGPKVALVDVAGNLVGHEKERVGLILHPGGGAEQDPQAWWDAIVACTRRLLDRLEVDAGSVDAICMSGQWGGLVPVDASGHHLHNALIWMDARGESYSRALTSGGITVPGAGYNARALRQWIAKTGGVPSRSGKDPVGQAQWLRHHRPDVYSAATYLLDVPEYLTMRLTGRAVAGFDTAVLRWCTDNRDPADVRYDPDLVRRAGFDVDKLPELVPPATVVGTLTPEAAAELGLTRDVQVVAGTGDTTAAAVGSGAVEDYAAHLYIGTSAWLTCHVPFKRTDLLRNIASLPAVVPGRYWVATVQDVAGKAIDWLIENVVYPDDVMGDGTPPPADALERLNALAITSPPGANGVVFAPWLNGERTPVDDATVRGGWVGVSLETTRADLVRAAFEGIALNARWMKEAVERLVHDELPDGFPAVTYIGGGAQSDLWCQTLADVLGCTVRQAEDPVLANARGAAFIAAIGIGALAWPDVPGLVRITHHYEPDPAAAAVHDRSYRTFTDLYRKVKGLYRRRR